MATDLIKQLVDHWVNETLIGGRKAGDLVVDGQTAASVEQFKTLLAEKLRTESAAPGGSGGGGGSSYLVYTALLTQTATDAPVATVLENTLGGTVVWTRNSAGNYTATLAAAFPLGRTICPPFGGNGNLVVQPIASSLPLDNSYQFIPGSDGNTVSFQCYDNSDYSNVEFSDISFGTSVLIKIEVYPV